MKLFSNLPRRSYIILGTFLVLAALFAYYFWVYLPAREDQQITKRVRDLQQIARNFKEKDKVYRKTANSIYVKDNIRSIFENCKDTSDRKGLIKQLSAELNKASGNPNLLFIDSAFKEASDIAYPYTSANSKEDVRTCGVELAASVGTFFEPFQKTKRFDDYLLFKGNALAYKTVDGELLQLSSRSSDNGFDLDSVLNGEEKQEAKFKLDQLEKIPEIYEPGRNVQLSAVKYKLFSTNILDSNDEVWTIYALVNAENFEADIKMIPYMVVIVIAVLLLILIFALPLIKLSLISPIERLHRIDVVLSTSSFVICTSLLSLFILFGTSYRADLKNREDQLKDLSNNINGKFEQELLRISELMAELGEAANAESARHDFTHLNIYEYEKLHQKLNSYAFLRNLYWMDDQGTWRYQISTETETSKAIEPKSFKERPYFYEIANHNGWHSDTIKAHKAFYVQSITSWLNSEKLAVISVPVPSDRDEIILAHDTLKNIKVLAASIRLHALMDPLLPPAFSYCVINEDGDVLFHSDKEKNLQENFLAEIDEHSGVRSAIYGKNSIYAQVNAGVNSRIIHMRPLKHTPWMLVTEYNKAYIESPYLQLISLCVICILLIGATAFFQLYLISLFDHKRSKLKKQEFYYDWLWPVMEKRENYFRIMLYNIVLAIALWIYHIRFDLTVLQVLTSFLYAVIFSNCSGWVMLEEDSKQKVHRGKIILGVTFAVSLILYMVTSFITEAWGKNLIVLLLVAFISFPLYYPLSTDKKIPLPFINLNFRNAYWGMLFTYLLISSVLPAFFLYSSAYVQEQEIWTKYELYEISKAREDRNVALQTLYKDKIVVDEGNKQPDSIYKLAIHEGNYYDMLNYKACSIQCNKETTESRPRWDSLLHRGRPFFTNMFVASNGFIFTEGGVEWSTERCETHGIRMCYQSVKQGSEEEEVLAGAIGEFNFAYLWSNLEENTFWLLLLWVAFLVAVYYAIRFATNKFFAMELFNNLQTMKIDDAYLDNYFSDNVKEEEHKHLFVVALPFAGTHQLYNKKHLKVFDVPQLLDEKECAKVLKIKKGQVVLEHFSYVIEDMQANKQILDIVERLLRNQNNIIIVSRLSPSQIIDHYEGRIAKMEDAGQKAELEVQMSKWKDILAGFVKVYYSLLHENTLHQKYAEDFSIKELLAYEFRVNEQYFKRIKKAFTQQWEEDKIVLTPSLEKVEREKESDPIKHRDVKEEIILKIQSMAQPFYYSLWNTCSKEEKYLLYDLAMDGFVNTNNERGLKKLLEKGLIYYQESLMLMNESFRNFILSTIKETESLAMEKELRRSGNWSLYSSIFLILLVSLIVFVSLSQKEIISQFVALLAGLATAIPYLLRFSGFFSSISGKSKLSSAV